MEKRTDEKKKMKKGIRGITLIALVVTIVILLILAGVTLNLVIGNNGIINKAGDAKNSYKKASEEEKEALRELERDLLANGNIPVEKVTDTNPGQLEGSGTEEAPYLIESIEDLFQLEKNQPQ